MRIAVLIGTLLLAGCGGDPRIVSEESLGERLFAIVVDGETAQSPDAIQSVVAEFCRAKRACRVGVWGSVSAAPRSSPISEASLEEQLAAYTRVSQTGFEQFLIACERFESVGHHRCMAIGGAL